MDGEQTQKAKRNQTARLLITVTVMFGFGFALVPLYDLICDITGLNGRDDALVNQTIAAPMVVDESREIVIEFITTVNGAKPWAFKPEQQTMKVHPGQMYTMNFTATNPLNETTIAQAIPSVSPWKAAKHLRKTECFCFEQQTFTANESRSMPVVFMIDPELPQDVDRLTLSYTFFELTNVAHAQ